MAPPVASSLSPHRCCVGDIPTDLLVDMAETLVFTYPGVEPQHTCQFGDSVKPDSFPELAPVSHRPQQHLQFPAFQISQWDRHKVASCRCDEHFQASSDLWNVKPD